MRIIIILMMLFVGTVFSKEISIEQTPKVIVKGEKFQLIFTLKSELSDRPYVSFNPGRIEVLNKKITHVIILPKGREWTYIYTMVSPNPGSFLINNVEIELKNRTIKKPNISIQVLEHKPRPKDFFTVAIPSKESVFVGEGFDVNYYVYSRIKIFTKEVQRFPKLNGLIKRVNMVTAPLGEEKVKYDGVVYSRQVEYSVRLYSQNSKNLFLDRMGFKVSYAPKRAGFGSRRTKVIWGKGVAIEIKPLPTNGLPKDFIGLVGRHKFKLEVPKRDFLINNPFEVKLTVEGEGALEALEAPVIYENERLEAFDTISQIQKISKRTWRKVFTYTYLGRGELNLDTKVVSLSYFDPDGGKYESFRLQVPPISIVKKLPGELKTKAKSFGGGKTAIAGVIAPKFVQSKVMKVIRSSWIDLFNLILGFVLALIVLSFIPKKRSKKKKIDKKLLKICHKIRKKGPDYNKVHTLLSNLSNLPDGVNITYDRSLTRAVEDSQLSLEAKQYFKELIIIGENVSYGDDKVDNNFVYKSGHFKKLLAYIRDKQNLEHENNP